MLHLHLVMMIGCKSHTIFTHSVMLNIANDISRLSECSFEPAIDIYVSRYTNETIPSYVQLYCIQSAICRRLRPGSSPYFSNVNDKRLWKCPGGRTAPHGPQKPRGPGRNGMIHIRIPLHDVISTTKTDAIADDTAIRLQIIPKQVSCSPICPCAHMSLYLLMSIVTYITLQFAYSIYFRI